MVADADSLCEPGSTKVSESDSIEELYPEAYARLHELKYKMKYVQCTNRDLRGQHTVGHYIDLFLCH